MVDTAHTDGGIMKKLSLLLAVALVTTVVSGCGGRVSVKITNDLGAWNIEEIYIDPAEDANWSDNRISDAVEPGDDTTISVVAGTYDIMIVDEDGDSYTRWDIEIGSEGYDWAITLSDIDE